MKKSVFSVVLLLFSALVWWASVGIREAAAMGKSAPAGDPTAVDAIKQLEQDMGNAMVAGDVDKLNQIYADDWATVGSSGKTFNKESVLDDFKSGEHKLLSFEQGPIDVQMVGMLPWPKAVSPKRGPGTEKTLVLSLFGMIPSRSAQANGWSCAAQMPVWSQGIKRAEQTFRDPGPTIYQGRSAFVVVIRNALGSDTWSRFAICTCGRRRITSI